MSYIEKEIDHSSDANIFILHLDYDGVHSIETQHCSWVWCYLNVILTFGRLRQENAHEFKASLNYRPHQTM